MAAIRLYAKVQNPGSGKPPLLLLHGLFGSWENLGTLARGLAEAFEVHALDLRNHGRSPHTESMSYPLMALDVLAYMAEQGLTQVYLLGHSMGGKTAMQVALAEPGKILGVVVLDIAPVTYPPGHVNILEGLRTLPLNEISSRQEADLHLKPFVPELPVRSFLLKNLIKVGEQGFAWRMNLRAIDQHYNEIRVGVTSETPYEGAVLFIKGGQSDYIERLHQTQITRLFPAADLRVVPQTGHWLHAEKPDTVLQVCLRFLLRLTSSRSQNSA